MIGHLFVSDIIIVAATDNYLIIILLTHQSIRAAWKVLEIVVGLP